MLEANPEAGVEYEAAEALPDAAPEAQKRAVADAKAWLQSLPLSRRPLCKVQGLLLGFFLFTCLALLLRHTAAFSCSVCQAD